MSATLILSGIWPDPNGHILPLCSGLPNIYYQVGTIVNRWLWDTTAQVWQPAETTSPASNTVFNGVTTGAAGQQVYNGPWADPNGNFLPADQMVTNLYYENGTTLNIWQWDNVNLVWQAEDTTT